MTAGIRAIAYHLPETEVTSASLAAEFPDWSVDQIEAKTGIRSRRIALGRECASDLAYAAAMKLFDSGVCAASDINFVLLCTQSPDYFLPTTACLLQDRLGIPTTAGALDFNLGCSGFIYGLGLAKALVETGQAQRVLLITAETYSKFMAASDRSTRTIFGDGAAATLISGQAGQSSIGPFFYGTDGRGAQNLIVKGGAWREPKLPATLFMDGPEIFAFTLREIPTTVAALLERAGITSEDIDLFVFHQANQYMLDHLRRKLRIPPERFYLHLANCGNTVSATIPIALSHAASDGTLQAEKLVMLVGFGVGYSWGATLVRWSSQFWTGVECL